MLRYHESLDGKEDLAQNPVSSNCAALCLRCPAFVQRLCYHSSPSITTKPSSPAGPHRLNYGYSLVQSNPFGLIQTCRQINRETFLLPFDVMSFEYIDRHISSDFLDSLSHEKTAAITTIKIHRHHLLPGYWQEDNLWALKITLERCIGLKRVVVTEYEPSGWKDQRKADIETAFACLRPVLCGRKMALQLDDVYAATSTLN